MLSNSYQIPLNLLDEHIRTSGIKDDRVTRCQKEALLPRYLGKIKME